MKPQQVRKTISITAPDNVTVEQGKQLVIATQQALKSNVDLTAVGKEVRLKKLPFIHREILTWEISLSSTIENKEF